MKVSAWTLLIMLAASSTPALGAADHGGPRLSPQQQFGRRLFEQSCGVCHTRPTLVAGMFGPELSKDNAGGNEEYLRTVISEGTARMPAFKYMYSPEQIAAVAAYLKTLPRGTQDIPTARAATKAPTPMQ